MRSGVLGVFSRRRFLAARVGYDLGSAVFCVYGDARLVKMFPQDISRRVKEVEVGSHCECVSVLKFLHILFECKSQV